MAQTGEAAARPEAPAPAAAGKNEQRRQTIENALKILGMKAPQKM